MRRCPSTSCRWPCSTTSPCGSSPTRGDQPAGGQRSHDHRATSCRRSDVVQFGATAVSFRVFSRSSDSERDQLGQVPFRRTPHNPSSSRAGVQADRRCPDEAGEDEDPDGPIVAPIVMGLGMFADNQSRTMLMTIALSPVMAAPTISGGARAVSRSTRPRSTSSTRARQAAGRGRAGAPRGAGRADRPVARPRRPGAPGDAPHARPVAAATARRGVPPHTPRARHGRSQVTVEPETSGDDEPCGDGE